MRVRLVPASLVHVGPLANTMRAADRRECEAFGRSPRDALRVSLRTSIEALTAKDPAGRVLAMFGVCSTSALTGKGTPWLLASDRLFDHSTDLMRIGPRVLAVWLDRFDELSNLVTADNDRAIALLKHWGADVDGDTRIIGGVEFVPFRFSAAIQAARVAA